MHVGHDENESKTMAVFFPENVKKYMKVNEQKPQAMQHKKKEQNPQGMTTPKHQLPPKIVFPDGSHIHFTHQHCYLDALIHQSLWQTRN
jgi:hypothetical protein